MQYDRNMRNSRPQPVASGALDAILPTIEQPARYTGGEWNSVRKDWETVSVHWALAFPELYEVGMSNLGMTILYELLNGEPDTLPTGVCTRHRYGTGDACRRTAVV